MASFRSIFVSPLILTFVFNLTSALYEDQVGTFDWKRSFIGKVKYACFDTKRILVATEENVLASLSTKNGEIHWRQVLEDPRENQIQLLHHNNKDLITISGGQTSWAVRSWDATTGTMLSEWNLVTEKSYPAHFIIRRNKLIHVANTRNNLEVSYYLLQTGEKQASTSTITTPWISDASDCLLTNNYYVCLSRKDATGQIYFVDILSDEITVHQRPLTSILGDSITEVELKQFDNTMSAFLLMADDTYLIEIEKDNIIKKPYTVMPNAVRIQSGDTTFLCQLEAASTSSGTDKLIMVNLKDFKTGANISSWNLDYPVGIGAPVILAVNTKGSVIELLLTTTDDAVLLVRMPEGKVLWTREEALSRIVATEFIELPVSELDASIENEFKMSSNSVIGMLTHRLSTQTKQVLSLLFGGHLLSDSGLVRDEFGLHKLIVVATRAGKLFAIDTLIGSAAWSYRLPNVTPFKNFNDEKMLLFAQRSARYAPLPAQCILLAEDATTGNGVMFQFDPITGYSEKGVQQLSYKVAQALILPYEDDTNLKPLLVLSSNNEVFIYPKQMEPLISKHSSRLYMYLVDKTSGILKGFNFLHSSSDSLKISPSWEVQVNPSKLIAVSAKHPNERVHSQGRVLPDRSVYYKYVNPNLIAMATISDDPVHKHVLSVYLIDGVTGLVLYSTSHKRAKGPVHMVHSENWLVYSFFNERFRRTEVVSAELYEGHVQSNSTVFSSHSVSLLPHVQTQSYILPATPQKMAVTLTERGITNKFLLLALSNGAVIEIPWLLLQPRFQDIPCGPEESCIPYMPEIPLPAEAVINYNQSLARIQGIQVAPARLESTIHVLVHGLDIFYTRVAPSKTFDVLKEDFDHLMIVLVLTGLIVASYITKYLAAKKALKQLWK